MPENVRLRPEQARAFGLLVLGFSPGHARQDIKLPAGEVAGGWILR